MVETELPVSTFLRSRCSAGHAAPRGPLSPCTSLRECRVAPVDSRGPCGKARLCLQTCATPRLVRLLSCRLRALPSSLAHPFLLAPRSGGSVVHLPSLSYVMWFTNHLLFVAM